MFFDRPKNCDMGVIRERLSLPTSSGSAGCLGRQRQLGRTTAAGLIYFRLLLPPSPDVAAVTGEMLQVSKRVNAGFADGQSCDRSERDFVVWRFFLHTYQLHLPLCAKFQFALTRILTLIVRTLTLFKMLLMLSLGGVLEFIPKQS